LLLLIDNYDSFTYNLYQALAASGAKVEVLRNDSLTVDEALAMEARAVVLSPGPGHPRDAGICMDLLAALPDETPLLGVCLGHQALVLHYGGELEVDEAPVHGMADEVQHEGSRLLEGCPHPFVAGRYHSLRARRESLPEELRLVAWNGGGQVMAVEHTSLPRYGVQFHPESILSPLGGRILDRFLSISGFSESTPGKA
jgi:anthranilate synthase component II